MRRMEELSSSTLSLDEVDDVIQDEAMWRDFVDVSDKLGNELPISTREMNAYTIMMATLLTIRSWQQPGAVANATLAEYKNRTEVPDEGETVTIIKVQLIGTNISRVSVSSVIFQNKFPMRAPNL